MAVTYPTPGSTFVIDVTAGAAGTSQINITAGGIMNFTAAGMAAVLNEVYTYYSTSSKLASVMRVADRGLVSVVVDNTSATFLVLNADVLGEVANLQAILQTAADVAA